MNCSVDELYRCVRSALKWNPRCQAYLRIYASYDDAVQDCVLHCWRRRGMFDPAKCSFQTWVRGECSDGVKLGIARGSNVTPFKLRIQGRVGRRFHDLPKRHRLGDIRERSYTHDFAGVDNHDFFTFHLAGRDGADVAWDYLRGARLCDIARNRGMTPTGVTNCLTRVTRGIRSALQ